MSSEFQSINIEELMAGGDEVMWTEEQKREMNMRIAKSRLQYRKTQMKAKRGGQGRYELRKRQLEMKNNHVPQSVTGVKPNDRLDPTDLTDVTPVKEKKQNHTKQEMLKSAPSKSKRKRMKKAQKAAAKKKAAEREAALEAGETIEIPVPPGTGDVESISIRLEDEQPVSVVGGAAETISPTGDLANE